MTTLVIGSAVGKRYKTVEKGHRTPDLASDRTRGHEDPWLTKAIWSLASHESKRRPQQRQIPLGVQGLHRVAGVPTHHLFSTQRVPFSAQSTLSAIYIYANTLTFPISPRISDLVCLVSMTLMLGVSHFGISRSPVGKILHPNLHNETVTVSGHYWESLRLDYIYIYLGRLSLPISLCVAPRWSKFCCQDYCNGYCEHIIWKYIGLFNACSFVHCQHKGNYYFMCAPSKLNACLQWVLQRKQLYLLEAGTVGFTAIDISLLKNRRIAFEVISSNRAPAVSLPW